MLTENYGGSGEAKLTAERCQPDYETMIARLNERLARETKMRNALLEYFKGKMAEMVGEIVTRCNSFQCELDGLIKKQEENQKEAYPIIESSVALRWLLNRWKPLPK